ncbi:MAG: hypothetical protein WCT31_02165 [Candidatus Micrarchaeia archaeon]
MNVPYLLFEKAKRQFLDYKPSADIFGPSSEIFVGKYGYPNIAAGPLVGLNPTGASVSPKELFGKDYAEILAQQASFVRGNKNFEIKSRMRRDMEEVALSEKAIDVEMQLTKVPYFNLETDAINKPMGASAPIKKFMQAENPKIPGKVDSIVNEDITATLAISELMDHGFDNYYITNIFSVGTLGMEKNKRLVPTRWSITAVDDIIAKQKMEQIRDYPEIKEVTVYSSSFLDNHFHILLIPGKWEFENFESWPENGMWAGTTEEYEGYYGRTKYADKQVGGYYASRFSVVDYLDSIRKQAKAVVFREIGEWYIAPVGVWQVRENVRNAFENIDGKFASVKDAMAYLERKLNVKMKKYLSMSRILSQRRLTEF